METLTNDTNPDLCRRCCAGNNRLFDKDEKKRVGRQDFYGGGDDDLFDVFDTDPRHREFDEDAKR